MPAKKSKATLKIQDALMVMMRDQHQAVVDISVTDLCNLAGVSRNTFYYHYGSPIDVYNSMLRDNADQVLKYVNEYLQSGDMHTTLCKVLELIKSNPILFDAKSYMEFNNTDYIQASIVSFNKTFESIYPLNLLNADHFVDVVVYAVGGNSQMILRWIKNGMDTPVEELATTMVTMNESLLQSLMNKQL